MQEKQKKPRKKRLLIVLLLLFILLVSVVLVFVCLQKNNLKALSYASKYSREELVQKEQEVNAKLQEIVDTLPDVHVAPLTEEEQKKLESGELSEEEALKIISGTKQEGGQTPPAGQDEKPQTSKVNDIIAKFYLLKAEYLNSINGLLAQGKAEWRSLPKKERTMTAKLNMANKYLSLGSSLESSCDGRMQTLLGELRTELEATGQSTAIIGEVTALYNEEKAVKKAALIDEYYPQI